MDKLAYQRSESFN